MNMAPNAFSDSYEVLENASLGFGSTGVLTNDTDADGDKLAAFVSDLPLNPLFKMKANGKFTYDADYPNVLYLDTSGSDGVLTTQLEYNALAPSDQFLLTNGFESLASGAVIYDEFEYTVTDGQSTDTETVTIAITGVNDDPIAGDDGGYEIASGAELEIQAGDLLENDTDVDIYPIPDDLIVELAAAEIASANGGTVTMTGGVLTYTAPEDFFGVDTFDYIVNDQMGGTDTGTVTVVVTPVNDGPIASPDSYSIDEDATSTNFMTVLANDDPTDEPGTDELAAFYVAGSLTVTASDKAGVGPGLLEDFNVDGTFTYNPNGAFEALAVGETATVQFQYTAFDGTGETSTTTVTMTVNGENDGPQLTKNVLDATVYESKLSTGSQDGPGSTTMTVGLLPSEVSDVDGDSVFLAGNVGGSQTAIAGTYGTLYFSGYTGDVANDLNVTYVLDSAANHSVTPVEEFSIFAVDGNGGSASVTVKVTIVDDYNIIEYGADALTGSTTGSLVDTVDDQSLKFVAYDSNNDAPNDGSDGRVVETFSLIAGADGQTLSVVSTLPTFDIKTSNGEVLGTVTSSSSTSNGETTVTGTIDWVSTTLTDGAFYSLVIDPDSGTNEGSYTFTQLQSLPTITKELDFSSISAGGPQETATVSQITFDGLIDWNGTSALFTGSDDPGGDDDINPNNGGGIGIGNGNINYGEVLVIDVSSSTDPISAFEFDLQGVGGGIGTVDVVWEAYNLDEFGNLITTSVATGTSEQNLKLKDAQLVEISPNVEFDVLYVALATEGDNAIDTNDSARINNIRVETSADVAGYTIDFALQSLDGDGDLAPADGDLNDDLAAVGDAGVEFSITVDPDFMIA